MRNREQEHDVVVLSDVHLQPGTPGAVVEALSGLFLGMAGERGPAARPCRVVLAGDFFDFSMVSEVPSPPEASFSVSRGERRFGLEASGDKTVWKIDSIFRRHPQLVPAMTRFLSRGNDVVFLPGNHDEELLLSEVQDHLGHLLKAPVRTAGADIPGAPSGCLVFAPWFYYEPGFAYVEHGHFYDRDNAPPSPLRPCPLPPGSRVDLPLGALVTRYLLSILRGYDSRGDADKTPWPLLVKVIRSHGIRAPLIIYRYYAMAGRVLRAALARTRGLSAGSTETPARFAARAGVTPEQLEGLLPLTPEPTTFSLRKTMGRLYLDRSAAFVAFVATTILFLPRFADGMAWNLGLPALSLGVLLFTVRKGNLFGQQTGLTCRQAAERIQEILDVPYVVMGHAHAVETHLRHSAGGTQRSYLNTGSFSESVLDDPHGSAYVVLARKNQSS